MKKIVYIDYNGTLRNDEGKISQRTKKAIEDFTKLGNHIVLCTGQPRYFAEEISKEMGVESFFISSNGAEIYNNKDKEIVKMVSLKNEDFMDIYEYTKKNDIRIVAVSEDVEFVTKEIKNKNQYMIPENNMDTFLQKYAIKQVMLISNNSDKIIKAKEELSKNNKSIIILNESDDKNNFWVVFGNSKASKGEAIRYLTKYLGETLDNTIAIGNGYNDISMFKVVGKSVAMENAENYIKNIVDVVTTSNNNDGVALFLEELLKEK